MNNAERIAAVFQCPESFTPVPAMEWLVYYQQTITRWQGEGLPAEFAEFREMDRFSSADLNVTFGLTPVISQRVSPYKRYIKPGCGEPCFDGTFAGYESIMPDLYPEVPLSAEVLAKTERYRMDVDGIAYFEIEGFFWFPRDLFGIEEHLFAFHDEPELMHRINGDLLEFNIRAIKQIVAQFRPEYFTIAEDISFNLGSMISEEMFNEFLMPYYKLLFSEIKVLKIPVIVDTDGKVDSVIPWYLEAGADGFQPFERMAGIDVNALRRKFPEIVMIGGFDKMVLRKGHAAIDAEFRRISKAYKAGGYIPSMDHQTPPECSLENYKIYCDSLIKFVSDPECFS